MTQPTSTEYDGIDSVIEEYMEAYNRGDMAGTAACYTENGQLLPPNSDFITGRQAIQEFWQTFRQEFTDLGVKSAKLIEVERHGDTAIVIGKAKITGEEDQVLGTAKYIVILKREKGQWKIHRDMWNSNTRLPE